MWCNSTLLLLEHEIQHAEEDMFADHLIQLSAHPETAEPDVHTETLEETKVDTPWRVILYDDDIHTFEDVILQLMKATGCTEQQASKHAFTVDATGKDCVFEGEFFDCFRVQGILREIQLVTEIEG